MSKYKGSCLCRTVKYEIDDIEPQMAHCHCSMCRKFHGAAFSTFGVAKLEHFRWLEGESNICVYIAENSTTRKFCGKCGSSLVFSSAGKDENTIEFTLGTLDTNITEQPDAHIHTNSKANWFQITDDLPCFSQSRAISDTTTEY